MFAYGEDDEVVGSGGAVGDERVGDDLDAVHDLDEQTVAGGRDGDVGAGAAEDVDGDGRLHRLRASDDRHQHLRKRNAAREVRPCMSITRSPPRFVCYVRRHDPKEARTVWKIGGVSYLLTGRRRH